MILSITIAALRFADPAATAGGPPPFQAVLASADSESIANQPEAMVESPIVSYAPSLTDAQTGENQSDITITARAGPVPIDPLQPINEASFKATQAVDTAITRPAAMAYEHGLPSPVRSGLRNFFLNLHEVDVFLNFLVQMKPGKAAETAGRFVVNSTIGVVGLFDMAAKRPFRLPRRRNSLADSLGYYGVGTGPFFFLPLIGPTTLRDFVGNSIDGLVLPTLVGKPFTSVTYTLPSTIVRSLDHRAEADDRLTELHTDPNPYAATRADYLLRRQTEIDHLRGRSRLLGNRPVTVPVQQDQGLAPIPTTVPPAR